MCEYNIGKELMLVILMCFVIGVLMREREPRTENGENGTVYIENSQIIVMKLY